MTWRMSRLRGRPPALAAGIRSLIQSQWRSAKSVGYVCVFIPQMYTILCADRHLFRQFLRMFKARFAVSSWMVYMKPTLIIFSGLPGTGKTTLARLLALQLRVSLVRLD